MPNNRKVGTATGDVSLFVAYDIDRQSSEGFNSNSREAYHQMFKLHSKEQIQFSIFTNYNYSEYLKGIRVIIWAEFSFLCSKWTVELQGGDFIG